MENLKIPFIPRVNISSYGFENHVQIHEIGQNHVCIHDFDTYH